MYFSSINEGNSIEINRIVTALEHVDDDNQPYYYIKFVLTNGAKIEWKYYSKETRDKEIEEIRKLRDKLRGGKGK